MSQDDKPIEFDGQTHVRCHNCHRILDKRKSHFERNGFIYCNEECWLKLVRSLL